MSPTFACPIDCSDEAEARLIETLLSAGARTLSTDADQAHSGEQQIERGGRRPSSEHELPKTRTQTTWAFRRRFRKNAFGWRNTTALKALREAQKEIRAVLRKDPAEAARGATLLIERISPACMQVDDSSGALGSQIRSAERLLVDCITRAELPDAEHEALLERLLQAWLDDDMPWIETLADYWGELCGSPERARAWAQRFEDLIDPVPQGDWHTRWMKSDRYRLPLLPTLLAAGEYDEVLRLVGDDTRWDKQRLAVAALRAQGKRAEALRRIRAIPAEQRWQEAEQIAEALLLESGLRDQAWQDHGVAAAEDNSRVRWLKQLRERYPERSAEEVLDRLVETTPGQEGRWFAAARQAGMLTEAIALARSSPAEPATLQTALLKHAESDPTFAWDAGMLAIEGLIAGNAFDPEKIDVKGIRETLLGLAARHGWEAELRVVVEALFARKGGQRDLWVGGIKGPILRALDGS